MRIVIPKEELNDMYTIKRLPIADIANRYSCDKSTIYDDLHRYNIPIIGQVDYKRGRNRYNNNGIAITAAKRKG